MNGKTQKTQNYCKSFFRTLARLFSKIAFFTENVSCFYGKKYFNRNTESLPLQKRKMCYFIVKRVKNYFTLIRSRWEATSFNNESMK